MMKTAVVTAVVAALCLLQVCSVSGAQEPVLFIGDPRRVQLGQAAFKTELAAFMKGDTTQGYNFNDPAFQAALTANIDSLNILAQSLNLASGITYTASGAIGTAGAVTALEIAAALYADSLASLGLELEAFERTFETDLPDNIAAVGRIVQRFSNARAAVAGQPQALAASLFGQSADPVTTGNANAIVGGMVGSKIDAALAAITDAKALLGQAMSTKAGTAISGAISA